MNGYGIGVNCVIRSDDECDWLVALIEADTFGSETGADVLNKPIEQVFATDINDAAIPRVVDYPVSLVFPG